MEFQEYLAELQNIQKSLLDFIESDENYEENFEVLIKQIKKHVQEDENELKLVLLLINIISSSHHRTNNFFFKIEKILLLLKPDIQKFFTNSEIYNIFKDSKRLLYFLFQSKILIMSEYIMNDCFRRKIKNYHTYFFKEIKSHCSTKSIKEIEDLNQQSNIDPNSEEFEANRKNGQNETKICTLIREDNIDEFITYIAKEDLSLNMTIKPSIFETNPILMTSNVTLLQYSAFFGSIQIFKYLFLNDADIKRFLWIYAIHGNNPELIHFLEEKNVEPEDRTYRLFYAEAAICHHNEIAEYLKNNYIKETNEFFDLKSFQFYNFLNFSGSNLFNRNVFFYLCHYGFYSLVEKILKNRSFDINYLIKEGGANNTSFIATPLLVAIMNDNSNIVKLLLEHQKNDFSFKLTRCSWTKFEFTQNALFLAVVFDNPKTVKYLINTNSIDINQKSYQKVYKPNSNMIQIIEEFPLSEAIANKNIDIIKLLLSDPNLDINLEKTNYYTTNNAPVVNSFKRLSPLNMSIMKCDFEIVKLILSNKNVNVNNISKNAIHDSEYNESPLFFSIRMNNADILGLLINLPDIDVNIKSSNYIKDVHFSEPILQLAIEKKNLDIIKILLSNKNLDVNMPLIKELNDAEKNVIEMNPLLYSVIEKNESLVRLLFTNDRIDVNAKYVESNINHYEEKSALYKAVENEDENMVKLLLSHPNIDVNYRSLYKAKDTSKITKTPILHLAIKKLNVAIVELLLNSPSIDVNSISYKKNSLARLIEEVEETALNVAINNFDLQIIQLLLEKPEINVNLKSKITSFSPSLFFIEEKTPIQTALFSDKEDVFKVVFNKLIDNEDLNENLNELIKMTNNEKIKALIYNGINRLAVKL